MNKVDEKKDNNPKKSKDREMGEITDLNEKLSEMHSDIKKVMEHSTRLRFGTALESSRQEYSHTSLNNFFVNLETELERNIMKKCPEKGSCTSKFTAFLNHNFPEVSDLLIKQMNIMSSENIYNNNQGQESNISAIEIDMVMSEILEPISNKQRLVILKAVVLEQKSFSALSKLTGLTAGNLLFHLHKLMDSELILQQHERGNYMITEKGFKILQNLNDISHSPQYLSQKIYHPNSFGESKKRELTEESKTLELPEALKEIALVLGFKVDSPTTEFFFKHLHQLVNQVPIPLCFVNKDGVLIYFNDRFVTTFGYTHEDVPTQKEWWQLAYPDEDYRRWVVDIWETAVQYAIQEKANIMPMEFNVTCKDGKVRIVEISGIIIEGGFLAALTDLTDHKMIEKARKETEAHLNIAVAVENERQRLFDMLETLPIMVCLLTSDYYVAFANRSFREKYGEFGGKRCYEYCFERTKPCDSCESYKVLKTVQPHSWETKGPGSSVIEAYAFPFTDIDGSPMILKMNVDVTEQKKETEKVQALANVVESSNDAILILSLDGIITTWNKSAEQIYGYSSEEIIGKCVSTPAPDNLKDETKMFIEKIKLGEKVQNYVTSRLRKDGKLIYVSISLSPVFDSIKKLVAVSAIVRDITQRIEAKKSLVKAEKTSQIRDV